MSSRGDPRNFCRNRDNLGNEPWGEKSKGPSWGEKKKKDECWCWEKGVRSGPAQKGREVQILGEADGTGERESHLTGPLEGIGERTAPARGRRQRKKDQDQRTGGTPTYLHENKKKRRFYGRQKSWGNRGSCKRGKVSISCKPEAGRSAGRMLLRFGSRLGGGTGLPSKRKGSKESPASPGGEGRGKKRQQHRG